MNFISTITLSKSQVKHLQSLKLKKFRQRYKSFIVEGDKIAKELINYEFINLLNIYAVSDWIDANQEILTPFTNILHQITERDLKKISNLKTPNKVLMEVEIPYFDLKNIHLHQQMSLFLDEIQDPGNMGTILRIADWFGIPFVFLAPNCVDIYNSKVIQASMGAFLRIKTLEISLSDLKNTYPDIPILGAVINGENIYQITTPSSSILVIGNEGKGISKTNLSLLDQKVSIPKGENGGAESLNASVATGILCSILSK